MTGNGYTYVGQYKKAINFYKKSLVICSKLLGNDHILMGSTHLNIGITYESSKDYEKALFHIKKAFEIYKKNAIPPSKLYGAFAGVYSSLGDHEKAIYFFEKELSVSKKNYGEDLLDISETLHNMSKVFFDKKDFDKAHHYARKSLEILKTKYTNHQNLSSTYNSIGAIFLEEKKYDNAILSFNKAIKTNAKQESSNNNNFDKNNYHNLNLFIRSLKGKGYAFDKLFENKKNIEYLKKSDSIYKQADNILNVIRSSFKNHQDKITAAELGKKILNQAIGNQLSLYNQTKDKSYLNKALYYSEKSKFNILKESLLETDMKTNSILSNGIRLLRQQLRIKKSYYKSEITKAYSKERFDSLNIKNYESKLFDIDKSLDSISKIIESRYPNYYQLKHQNNIISVGNIQKKIDYQTTILEFFTSDSITYAFTISKNKITVKELKTPKLIESIQELRRSISDKNIAVYKSKAHRLYKNLIAPIQDLIVGDRLIIIPDGPLWHLNFDLLLTQNNDSNNPKKLSYLLKNYTISYANSANLLFTPFKNNLRSKKLKECLAFSFSDSTNIVTSKTMSMAILRDTGDDLPGTRKEIKAIADIINGQYFYGSEAIETNFKKNASQYNILHLALHGEVDNEHPENSKLFFTKSKDTLEDNLLYSHELFALDIPAELTVLSACNTGTGKIAKGEGIMSLGTAFQYAGTKSLLLSSWEVSDQTTPELMKYFYTNLKSGMNKAKALQQAKLEYLNTANINRTHPFYWGGFYLVGDASTIQFSNDYTLYWVIGLMVFVLVFIGIFWRNKKSSILKRKLLLNK
ncbi:CHAT domain-containing protein [Aquimarina sp. 2201CG14-23]|uniref:CHAT domain-containing protein n=1 Tax=Aquimarina mycalae TaxID=3040073 RepID=UPI0024780E6E|nr:CHAT domain-containing tetratricopeptide repeat protein [Aquimarina sp. 2201CG14-23]MDH7446017.1 CHAT domain-containing protein [Aquimarina sp. 2201CG14-23]